MLLTPLTSLPTAKTITDEFWRERREEAEKLKEEKERSDGTEILIVPAAQHPLKADGTPGVEFQLRLTEAVLLAQELSILNARPYFYIPGSRHGKDLYSLSDAGTKSLLRLGVGYHRIFGEDANLEYTNDMVYHTGWEAYVASTIFKQGNFRQIYSVVSTTQRKRNELHYLANGVRPEFREVSVQDINPFHGKLSEALLTYWLENIDPLWHLPNSFIGNLLTRMRKPKRK